MAELDRLIRYEPDPEIPYRIDVLVRAPIIHAQFEAIHTFLGGNGRVGRLWLRFKIMGMPVANSAIARCPRPYRRRLNVDERLVPG